jgi:ABC-type multidrug transport system ATPase subunit
MLRALRHAPAPTALPAAATTRGGEPPLPPPATILSLVELRKRFRRVAAVDGVTLNVSTGQAVALWGANGAGKTTIIKCILGLHRCQGRIRVAGVDARRHGKRARQRIGYVSQELAFDPDVSTLAATAFFARLKGTPPARAAQVLRQVGLSEQGAKRVGALSGGMKQRLALAIALLADPPLLLLDEPTSNLDVAARRAFLQLLGELKQAGKTIVFTTHRPEEVADLADRVIVLERGRVAADAAPDQLGPFAPSTHTLRLPLAREHWETASAVLRAAGFAVQPNCDALCVQTPRGRKAEPIELIARAGMAVGDFELETDAHDAS